MNAHNLAKSAMNFNAEKYFEIGYKPPIKQRKKKKQRSTMVLSKQAQPLI